MNLPIDLDAIDEKERTDLHGVTEDLPIEVDLNSVNTINFLTQ